MGRHSSILAWKIPWMEEPGGWQSMGSLRVGHDWVTDLNLTEMVRICHGLNCLPSKFICWSSIPSTLAAAAAKSLQSCLTLCNPIEGSPPGSTVPGILQARTLQWVAISFSNAWKWKVKVKSFSCVWLLATPWTAAHQAPLSMGFPRQEYWSGVPLPSPICVYNNP